MAVRYVVLVGKAIAPFSVASGIGTVGHLVKVEIRTPVPIVAGVTEEEH